MLVLGALILLFALAWWWFSASKGVRHESGEHSGRTWTHVDWKPGFEREFSKTPERIEHEVEFAAGRYRWTAWFTTEDPWAESEVTRASREHALRRRGPGVWEVRLMGRNGAMLDVPGAWEPAPPDLVEAWEAAWARSHGAASAAAERGGSGRGTAG